MIDPRLQEGGRHFFAPLHGLRGIAVLYVVVSHLGNDGAFLIPVPHDGIGKVGVWIFFALSAYLLTAHLQWDFRAGPRDTASVSYAINRVCRIFPLYLLVIAAHAVVGDFAIGEAFRHVLLISGWGELWAIPVEFQYYVVIPVIALAAVAFPVRRVAGVLALGVVASVTYGISNPQSVFSNDLNVLPRIAPFLLGSMLAILTADGDDARRAANGGRVWAVAGACLLGLVVATLAHRWMYKGLWPESAAPWVSLLLGVSVVGLIHVSLQPGKLGELLASRALVFLGEISFSLYLLHMFFIRFVTRLASWPDFVEAWVSLVLSIACAYASYRIVEQPGIRAGKRLGERLRRGGVGRARRIVDWKA